MSIVNITMINAKGNRRLLNKEGNCISVQDEQGEFIQDIVHGNELTAQAHLNYLLLYLKDNGFVRE